MYEICGQYENQTVCGTNNLLLSVSQYNRGIIIQNGSYVNVLVGFLKAGSLQLQRETVCILHYLSLDKEHIPILLNEGVYDIATKLGMHSDAKIKRSCKSILQLVKSVNEELLNDILSYH